MSILVKTAFFAGGLLFGTAGLKLLSSKTAKKVYTHTTAAVLRGKDCVLENVTKVREGCDDILADAKDINEKKSAEDSEIVDYIEDTPESEE
ncbi:DUF6110 family protein [Ruminococcus sp.]|uniref:DUF6110 family protein n=1 Tax=Ruminococcus sp. TaxID=41978 RepID=UPI0025D9E5DD|nr:DUF6110 family protein [Ruminococcus sp.]MBQ8967431.1 hypothetical protein [Ruminococcus sp.]